MTYEFLFMALAGSAVAGFVAYFLGEAIGSASASPPDAPQCRHAWKPYMGPGGGAKCWKCGDHAPELRAGCKDTELD